jgi:ELWxxDGT repeat protein
MDPGHETVWLSEGTPESTRPLADPPPDATADAFIPAGDRFYFKACDAGHGCELWSADRLGGDRRLVVDLWPGPRSSDPEILTVGDGVMLFAATEPTAGRELWRLDLRGSATPGGFRGGSYTYRSASGNRR